MVNIAEVKIWGITAGAVYWDNKKRLAFFEYDPSFLKKGAELSPLKMPNRTGTVYSFPDLNFKTFYGLPGLLADSLPDEFGTRLIDHWLKKNNIDKHTFSPVDRLCFIGNRGMGALEFEPAINRKSDSKITDIEKMVYLSSLINSGAGEIHNAKDDEKALDDLIIGGTSVGGQRPKIIIAFDEETGELRSAHSGAPKSFTAWIVKFDGASGDDSTDPEGFGRIEYAYYLMALDCGVEMMKCRLFHENGRAHFMTRRFDRSGSFEKYHTQTLCSLAHFDFNSPAQYSYEDTFEVMRRLRLPHTRAVQMFRRLVFNVIARNQDDHAKNISFIMDKKGRWDLAPAYDVTFAYNPEGKWTDVHQMSINGKTDRFTMDDLLSVAGNISLKNGREIVEDITDTCQNWHLFADEAGVPESRAESIGKTFRLNL